MFSLSLEFDIKLNLDKKECNTFDCKLYCITLDRSMGDITGSITRNNNKKIFTIDTSEIDVDIRGTGIGFKFYIQTIKKCFEYGCTEFRSSTNLNEYSHRTWKKILQQFYNTEKIKGQYIVRLPNKQIL